MTSARPAAAEREPYLRIVWTDPVTGRHGYAVIDRLIDGISGGGTRVRAGVTLGEIERIARVMTHKNGAHKVRVGGAKGGLDCDPRDPELRPMLLRFVGALAPMLSTCWATAEDLGIGQEELDDVFAQAGLRKSWYAALRVVPDRRRALPRMAAALRRRVEGVALADTVGGFGVAEATLEVLARAPESGASTRAVVQGFGSMGGASARYLSRNGLRVVGIVDADGAMANPDGLDVETLLAARDRFGVVDRSALRSADRMLARDDWLELDADVIVPAALEHAITLDDVDRVTGRVVVEAGNVACTPEARDALHARGVTVIPDFVANGGANAWWWWTLRGEIDGSVEQSLERVSERMHDVVGRTLELAADEGIAAHRAAVAIAEANLADG